MKKRWILLAVIILLLCIVLDASAATNGWKKEGVYLCYYSNGEKVTGAQTINSDIYYFTDEGYLKANNNQIQKISSYGSVYIDENNQLVTGWQTINGYTYYFFPETGKAAVYSYSSDGPSILIDGVRYAFNSNGVLLKNLWYNNIYGDNEGKALLGYQTIGTRNYLFSETGKIQTGFHEIDGNLHYFHNEPIASILCYEARGWVEVSNSIYYFDPQTGVLQTTSQTIDGVYYTLNTDGTLQHSDEIVLKLANGDVCGYDQENNKFSGWKTINGETYYFRSDGLAYQGYYYIDDGDYYFDSMGRMQKDAIIWIKIDSREGLYYFASNGKRKSGWITLNGLSYYFGYSGAYIGRQFIGENYYFFDDNGVMQSGCFQEVSQSNTVFVYYYGMDGKEASNWTQIGNETYFFGPAMYTDVHEINGGYYYFDENGKLQRNILVETKEREYSDNKYLYYYGEDGKRCSGWLVLGNDKYYFTNLGLFTGELYLDEGYYLFDNEGKLQINQLIKKKWSQSDEEEHLFYYGSDGRQTSGWQEINGNMYYFHPYAYTDVWQIGEDYYYFNDNGIMQTNLLIKINDDGTDHVYYFGSDGKQVSGWHTINGAKYYFWSEGAYIGHQVVDGVGYYFDADGKMQTNSILNEEFNGTVYTYYFGSDGKQVNDWVTIDGSTYYFFPDKYTNAWEINGEYYFFDDQGRMQKNLLKKTRRSQWDETENLYYYGPEGKRVSGWQTINGSQYYFDNYTYIAQTGTMIDGDITYTFSDDGKLVHKEVPANRVSLDVTYIVLDEGNTRKLTATVSPSDAVNKNVIWHSDDEAVAKVDAEGIVTAIAEGHTNINVTTENGKYSAFCHVQVNKTDKVEAFVTRCYSIILGRDPDAGGLKTWYNELISGRKAASEIIDNFVRSQEFLGKNYSNADAVEILYKAMLGRGSDPAGKADWVGKLDAGHPFAVVINGFCGSKEFKEICDSYGIAPGSVSMEQGSASDQQIRAFVTRCYKIILGRGADEVGMNTWFNELKSRRRTAAEIIEQFVYSQEFQNKKYSNPDAVEILYKAMLGRGSDPAGKADWVGRLNAGRPLTAIINGFCGSMEFTAICEAYGITPGSVKVETVSRAAEETPEETVQKPEKKANLIEITNPSDTVNEQLGTAVQAIYINEEKAKEFIGRCYRVILGREAGAAELDGWISQMTDGSKTADQIARGFLFSGEFKDKNVSNEELVKILYRVYMNREADAEGLATWTQKLDEGTGLNDLLNVFAKTGEFKVVLKNMAE